MASDGIWDATMMDSNQIISVLSGLEGFVFPRNSKFGTYFILYSDAGNGAATGPRLYQRKPIPGKANQRTWVQVNIIVSSHEEHIYLPEMRRFVEKHN